MINLITNKKKKTSPPNHYQPPKAPTQNPPPPEFFPPTKNDLPPKFLPKTPPKKTGLPPKPLQKNTGLRHPTAARIAGRSILSGGRVVGNPGLCQSIPPPKFDELSQEAGQTLGNLISPRFAVIDYHFLKITAVRLVVLDAGLSTISTLHTRGYLKILLLTSSESQRPGLRCGLHRKNSQGPVYGPCPLP